MNSYRAFFHPPRASLLVITLLMSAGLYVADAIAALPAPAVWDANPLDCDAVLVQQLTVDTARQTVDLDWLKLITKDNYEQTKHSAAASYAGYVGYFTGNYDDFNAKRERTFAAEHFTLNVDSARYSYTSHLDAKQIEAWLSCKGGARQLAAYLVDEDEKGVTLKLSWRASADIGPLKIAQVHFDPHVAPKDLLNLRVLNGDRAFPLTRLKSGEAIRGDITGTSGMAGHSDTTTVYVAPWRPSEAVTVPPRYVVPLTGRVRQSWAFWGDWNPTSGRHHDECISLPPGFDMVVVREHGGPITGNRGACLTIWPACYRFHEGCQDIIIDEGCLVNTTWRQWYEDKQRRDGLPVSESAVCQIDQSANK